VILDISAILAVLFKEPGHESLIEKLLPPRKRGVGTPTLAEAGLVLTGRIEADGEALLSGFLQQFEVIPVPFWGPPLEDSGGRLPPLREGPPLRHVR
jgi:ribonuclease VapC